MLVLLLRLGDQRFGLDARDVLEIVPGVPLLPVPGAPAWIAGLLHHRDGVAPVVDLSRLVRGTPASARLSSRIVLLRRDAGAGAALVGLLAEGVTETARIDPARLRAAGLHAPDAPWLGPIALDLDGPVQLVRWTDLVPAPLRAAVLDGVAT
jgi:chemotaxis-related protein WspB